MVVISHDLVVILGFGFGYGFGFSFLDEVLVRFGFSERSTVSPGHAAWVVVSVHYLVLELGFGFGFSCLHEGFL